MYEFERIMLEDSYVNKSKGETAEDVYKRVAQAGADNPEHAERLLSYMEKYWFRPATPILSNLGTDNGLPISCFVQEIPDDKYGIFDKYYEQMVLSAGGGGVGSDWSAVRQVGAKIKNGKTAGIVPLMKIQEAISNGISQGSTRRGAMALYLDVHHPEIEEFIEIRKVQGASIKRRMPDIHHAVKISDEFMQAVINGTEYNLYSTVDRSVVGKLDAWSVFRKILETRMETGEPYLYFTDNVNKTLKDVYKKAGMSVKTSQVCSEIFLPTAPDYTAVCCIASPNAAKYDEWKGNYQFIEDIMRFLDNVMSIFIEKASKLRGYECAVKSAQYERSVALGIMGIHTYLQQKLIPFESAIAEGFQRNLFAFLKDATDRASRILAAEKGACPLSKEYGDGQERFTCKMAIAPTASVSLLCGMVSQGADPIAANIYTYENKTGKRVVRNTNLEKWIESYAATTGKDSKWIDAQWKSISKNGGSVLHLDWMPQDIKDVFKTSFEIDQRWIIQHAAARQEYIDQGQSVNIFVPATVDITYLAYVHILAWKLGLKSLYYCRSTRANKATTDAEREIIHELNTASTCLSCE